MKFIGAEAMYMLQWGRRRETTEGRPAVPTWGLVRWLQWGRRRETTEGPHFPHGRE